MEKGGVKTLSVSPGSKPMSMKLFASWEVDRSAPNCIPRLCSLRLTRLEVLKPLESDPSSLIIAVRMQSSKRTLRSNEIIVPQGKLLDTELDLSFSLQYPHFLKRDGNRLRIMLQRRKRYKNRTILGFKTLAVGQINMSEVLQQAQDSELDLYGKDEEMTSLAKVTVLGLTSQPIDQVKRERNVDVDQESEDEMVEYYSSDGGENSDSGENMVEGQDLLGLPEEDQVPGRKPPQLKLRPSFNRQQRNIKKKFISLLKKFKVASDESDVEPFPDQENVLLDDDFLYDDIDELNISDSGTENNIDELSIGSTPKPGLRPYFSQGLPTSGSMADGMGAGIRPESTSSDSQENILPHQQEVLLSTVDKSDDSPPSATEQGISPRDDQKDSNRTSPKLPPERSLSSLSSDGTPNKGKRSSSIGRERPSSAREIHDTRGVHRRNNSADALTTSGGALEKRWSRSSITEQLSQLALFEEDLPRCILFINSEDFQGRRLASCVQDSNLVFTCSKEDMEATLQYIVQKLQKYCNQTPKVPSPVKLGICGSEAYLSCVMRPYVQQFSSKSPEWQNYVKFFYIPLGSNSLAKYLGSVDHKYNSLFLDATWKELEVETTSDKSEVVSRLECYLAGAQACLHLPIGEVMVTRRQTNKEKESNQSFIPFVNYVRIGPAESSLVSLASTDGEDIVGTNMFSSSPPMSGRERDGASTPPPSPSVGSQSQTNSPSIISHDFMDLQVEYWPVSGGKKDKSSLKTSFRSLTVLRLPTLGDSSPSSSAMSMTVVTKDKNKKTVPKVQSVMKIGKKSRDLESGLKSQVVDGIHRLVCTSRSQDYSLTVLVDGLELREVKFFQLSAQWQTHIKQFPISLFGPVDTVC